MQHRLRNALSLIDHYPKIGAHLRLNDGLTQVLQEVIALQLPVFQFFVARTVDKKTVYITPTAQDKALLRTMVTQQGTLPFIHASYWINPASFRDDAYAISKSLLKKEIRLAQELEVPMIVLHPGTANGLEPDLDPAQVRRQGIERLASFLNEVLAKNKITVLLENTAHGRNAIGSDLQDFHKVKALLDEPEKVQFCLDTAHAFAYGYDVADFDSFFTMFKETVGIESLRLIHLNDVEGSRGNKQDKHTLPGEGQLGLPLIKKIAHFNDFLTIPKIIELPASPIETIQQVISTLTSKDV